MIIDQLTIGNKSSYDDFEANVSERRIGSPKKKIIKDTVPFSNVTHDFSKIDGELYWEERTLEYIFEIDADTPEELEEKKIDFKTWVMNVFEEELHDPFIEDFHFIATFEDIDFDDSEIEKTTITVTFSAYPFMLSNAKIAYEFAVSNTSEKVAVVANNSSHRITPTLIASVPVSFVVGNTMYSVNAGETKIDSLKLEIGINEITIKPASASGTLKVEFFKEVF
jgi:hypothetical protein